MYFPDTMLRMPAEKITCCMIAFVWTPECELVVAGDLKEEENKKLSM